MSPESNDVFDLMNKTFSCRCSNSKMYFRKICQSPLQSRLATPKSRTLVAFVSPRFNCISLLLHQTGNFKRERRQTKGLSAEQLIYACIMYLCTFLTVHCMVPALQAIFLECSAVTIIFYVGKHIIERQPENLHV